MHKNPASSVLSFVELHLMATTSSSTAGEINCFRYLPEGVKGAELSSLCSRSELGIYHFCWFRVIPHRLTSCLGTEKTQREALCFVLNTLLSNTSLSTCSKLPLSGLGAIRLSSGSVRQAIRLENDEGGRPEAAALAALLYNTEVMQKCAEKTHCCEHAFPEGNSRTEVIMARWLLCFSV